MKDWISLFEKYRIDRRLVKSYRAELSALPDGSPRELPLSKTIELLEKKLLFIEGLLDSYDNTPASPREAVRRSQERLFLTYHYFRGMTMEETAEEMGISRDTVYRIRRRILTRSDAPDVYSEDDWHPLLFPADEPSARFVSPPSCK